MTSYSLPSMAHMIAGSQLQSSDAGALYYTAHATAQRRHLWACLTRRSNALLSLTNAQPHARGGHYAGRKQVKLADIRGTEGRAKGFDDQFYPLSDETRQRWQSVARALDEGLTLAPVQLIQVGGDLLVRDGHHRVSVTRALGQQEIEAEVTVWSVD